MITNIQDHASPIEAVTGSSFKRMILEAKGRIAVEFMSYGCGHCRALEPVLATVARTLESTEKFFRVNVAVDQDLATQYHIAGTPTLVMFLSGREVGRVEGVHPTISSVTSAVTRPFEI